MARPWLALVIVVGWVAVAEAKPRVALAAFKGDTKDHARRAVAAVSDHDLAIVAARASRTGDRSHRRAYRRRRLGELPRAVVLVAWVRSVAADLSQRRSSGRARRWRALPARVPVPHLPGIRHRRRGRVRQDH